MFPRYSVPDGADCVAQPRQAPFPQQSKITHDQPPFSNEHSKQSRKAGLGPPVYGYRWLPLSQPQGRVFHASITCGRYSITMVSFTLKHLNECKTEKPDPDDESNYLPIIHRGSMRNSEVRTEIGITVSPLILTEGLMDVMHKYAAY